MPPAHHWASKAPESRFPSRASHESQTARMNFVHPSSRSAPSLVACTQTGSRDRNTRTACTNAIQIRTSDISPRRPFPAARSHTARSATRPVFPADSPASDQARDPTLVDRSCVPAAPSVAPLAVVLDHYPDIHVDGIWPQMPPQASTYCAPARDCWQVYESAKPFATDSHGFSR